MKMKTYRAETFKDALDQIKSEWGAEAFVLSSRQVRAPGLRGILGRRLMEVTAGLDSTAAAVAAARTESQDERPGARQAQRSERAPLRRPAEVARQYAAASGLAGGSQQPASPVQQGDARELADLRRWCYSLTKLTLPPEVFLLGDPIGELYEELCANDVDPSIAKMLVNSTGTQHQGAGRERLPEMKRYVGSLIEKMVAVKTASKRVKIFLGPTGVGKTTTVAKLAARALVNREGKVGLVTMDTYRIGGAQQLRTYAEIMSAPVKVARSADELDRILAEWQSFDIVLIDTVGRSQRQLGELNDLGRFLNGRGDIERHLILSATTKALDLREIVEKFGVFAPDYLCFTKIDETATYGTILNEHHRTGTPLSYFGVGQRVPEDLEMATKGRVSELIIGGGN